MDAFLAPLPQSCLNCLVQMWDSKWCGFLPTSQMSCWSLRCFLLEPNSYPWVGNSCLRNPSCPTGIRSTKKNMIVPWHATKGWRKPSNEKSLYTWVVVSNMFIFHPYLGKWSNLTIILGCFNHQLATVYRCIISCCKKLKRWIFWFSIREEVAPRPSYVTPGLGRCLLLLGPTRGFVRLQLGSEQGRKLSQAQGSPCTVSFFVLEKMWQVHCCEAFFKSLFFQKKVPKSRDIQVRHVIPMSRLWFCWCK